MPAESVEIVIKINDSILLTKDWYEPRRHLIEVAETYFACQAGIVNMFSEFSLQAQSSSQASGDFFIKVADFLKRNGLVMRSLYRMIDNRTVLTLMSNALKVSDYKAENLLNFFVIEVSSDQIDIITDELKNLDGISYSYLRGVLSSMGPEVPVRGTVAGAVPPNVYQKVSSFFGAFGVVPNQNLSAGVKIIDLEQGWESRNIRWEVRSTRRRNRDVRSTRVNPTLGTGQSHNDFDHGTKTLNVIIGRREVDFVNGLCTYADVHTASTWYKQPEGYYLEGREAALAEVLGGSETLVGDIVLLELQQTIPFGGRKLWPTEADPAMLHTITYGVASGVIIISAAGNDNLDLGDLITTTFNKITSTTNLGHFASPRSSLARMKRFRAIMVGAQIDGVKEPLSNFGRRVDCYCFGEQANNYRTRPTDPISTFGGTSLASAIIASLAGNMQLMARNSGGGMTPDQMSEFLSSDQYDLPSSTAFLRFLARI